MWQSSRGWAGAGSNTETLHTAPCCILAGGKLALAATQKHCTQMENRLSISTLCFHLMICAGCFCTFCFFNCTMQYYTQDAAWPWQQYRNTSHRRETNLTATGKQISQPQKGNQITQPQKANKSHHFAAQAWHLLFLSLISLAFLKLFLWLWLLALKVVGGEWISSRSLMSCHRWSCRGRGSGRGDYFHHGDMVRVVYCVHRTGSWKWKSKWTAQGFYSLKYGLISGRRFFDLKKKKKK